MLTLNVNLRQAMQIIIYGILLNFDRVKELLSSNFVAAISLLNFQKKKQNVVGFFGMTGEYSFTNHSGESKGI